MTVLDLGQTKLNILNGLKVLLSSNGKCKESKSNKIAQVQRVVSLTMSCKIIKATKSTIYKTIVETVSKHGKSRILPSGWTFGGETVTPRMQYVSNNQIK